MIADRIFHWAARTPDNIAVVYNGEEVTYRAFAGFIGLARGHFVRRGVAGPGVAVLAVSNLMDFWVLSLALRGLGVTTLAAPSTEAIDELTLPQIRWVVTAPGDPWPGLAEACAARGRPLLTVALDGAAAPGAEAAAATQRPGGHILLSSGTTGARKLVLIDPAYEPKHIARRVRIAGIEQASVVCTFGFAPWTGVGYGVPTTVWSVGGVCIIHQGRAMYEPLHRPGITLAAAVPDMLSAILAAPRDAFPRSSTLRLIVTGAPMTWAVAQEAMARITPCLYGYLGATEVGIVALTRIETAEDLTWHKLGAGIEAQVVDDADHPLPPGKIGRLRLGSGGGPHGYLGDEAASRTFFKDGYFYPGDLALFGPDGRLALKGRVTDVINLNGRKIAPAPIEERLCEALGVTGACLTSTPSEDGPERVLLVIEASRPADAGKLAALLEKELFGYQPAEVRYAPVLPRNEMGKLMRQQVREQLAAGEAPMS